MRFKSEQQLLMIAMSLHCVSRKCVYGYILFVEQKMFFNVNPCSLGWYLVVYVSLLANTNIVKCYYKQNQWF